MSQGHDQRERAAEQYQRRFDAIVDNVSRVVRGKTDAITLAVVCMLADGHLLIEDVPGVGKTTLARALAESVDGSLQRIQFTPDLLPTDVTGVQIFNRNTNEFEFHEGAVFANVVVGDEINRASPKTQSALLEVMEEHQVTVDGIPRRVPDPFIVIATENPVELDGTYDLPEAQLDRFLMQISLGYPNPTAELEIIDRPEKSWARDELDPVVDTASLRRMASFAETVHISTKVKQYILALTTATRDHPDVQLGVSPRGSIALAQTGRALAAAFGRTFVTPDDVKYLAPFVLQHRVIIDPEAELGGANRRDIIDGILQRVPIPDGGR
ncbi:MAG: AAA family ATPase [Acidimicrobiales bacterium]